MCVKDGKSRFYTFCLFQGGRDDSIPLRTPGTAQRKGVRTLQLYGTGGNLVVGRTQTSELGLEGWKPGKLAFCFLMKNHLPACILFSPEAA